MKKESPDLGIELHEHDIRPDFKDLLDKLTQGLTNELSKIDSKEIDQRYTIAKKWFASLERNLHCESMAENELLLQTVKEISTSLHIYLGGDSMDGPYFNIGRMIFKDGMTKDQLYSMLQKVGDINFTYGFLNSGGMDILEVTEMDNEQIINLGKDFLNRYYTDTVESTSSSFLEWKNHNGHQVWSPLLTYLKFENISFEDRIEFALKHNEAHLYSYVIKQSKDMWMKLPMYDREAIATKIVATFLKDLNKAQSGNVRQDINLVGGTLVTPLADLLNYMPDEVQV